ncbi:MAG: hypothetical protein HYZ71_05720 [Deltaproteobacteria bacterium]|nr:hypothetical protein [Deltaproteobacteria bacterium]
MKPFSSLSCAPSVTVVNGSTDREARWHGRFRAMVASRLRSDWAALPLTQNELAAWGPGERILTCPRSPRVALTALRSAARVVSTHPDVVRAAQALGTPAVWVVESHRKQIALPQWSFSKTPDWEEELGHVFDDQRRTDFGNDRGVPFTATSLAVCCMASRDYLIPLAGFLENLRQVTRGRFRLHFLGLDDESTRFILERYAFCLKRSYRLEDLWSRSELATIWQRTRAQRAYMSKSRLMQRALDSGEPAVLYSDLDLFFFRSPQRLLKKMRPGTDALLFPHWNRSSVNAREHGFYNAGLLAARPGARPFLTWWARQCLAVCEKDARAGHYDDQRYLDEAAKRFRGLVAYRGRDEDLGAWNYDSLGVRWSDSPGELTAGRRSVGSIHTPQDDEQGFFEVKFGWDQMVGVMAGLSPSVSDRHSIWLLQRRYFPQVERLHQMYEALGNRIGRKGLHLPAPVERLLVRGEGRVTRGWPPVRRFWRGAQSIFSVRGENPQLSSSSDRE